VGGRPVRSEFRFEGTVSLAPTPPSLFRFGSIACSPTPKPSSSKGHFRITGPPMTHESESSPPPSEIRDDAASWGGSSSSAHASSSAPKCSASRVDSRCEPSRYRAAVALPEPHPDAGTARSVARLPDEASAGEPELVHSPAGVGAGAGAGAGIASS
jgi:hypothetical protein